MTNGSAVAQALPRDGWSTADESLSGTEWLGGRTRLRDGRLVSGQPGSDPAGHLHPRRPVRFRTHGCRRAIGAVNAAAFGLTAACSGFLFALVTAAQYLRSGAMRRILVVGADQLSRWVNWDDRRSCVLFGDAAGARGAGGVRSDEDDLDGFLLRSDGRRGEVLQLPQVNQRQPLGG